MPGGCRGAGGRLGALDEPTLEQRLAALQRSAFRRRFRLSGADLRYAHQRGRDVLRGHARRFLIERLAPARPARDGKQTPMRGHPVFCAQHATATCCRGCVAKWHGISAGRPLTDREIDDLVAVIDVWIDQQVMAAGGWDVVPSQPTLFE